MDLLWESLDTASEVGPPFILVKAAQWHVKPKMFDFPDLKMIWIFRIASTFCGP